MKVPTLLATASIVFSAISSTSAAPVNGVNVNVIVDSGVGRLKSRCGKDRAEASSSCYNPCTTDADCPRHAACFHDLDYQVCHHDASGWHWVNHSWSKRDPANKRYWHHDDEDCDD
jgi:hypothetical protein